jgi:hypothetical protein
MTRRTSLSAESGGAWLCGPIAYWLQLGSLPCSGLRSKESIPLSSRRTACAIVRRQRWKVVSDGARIANLLGLSTQLPRKIIYLARQRIKLQISLAGSRRR